MSNFSSSQARQSKATHNRQVKKHVNGFYKILNQLENIANEIRKQDVEVTEDNIEKLAFDVIGREIDSMEKFVLMGKLMISE